MTSADDSLDELRAEVARLREVAAAASERAAKAEEQLRASAAIHSATIESLPFDFFARDKDGYCFSQNSTTRENWGDLLHKRPEDMDLAPEVIETWLANNRRVLAGEIVRGDVEYVLRGETRYIHNVLSPIRMEDEIVGLLGVNIDVTERRRAEAERLKLELRMRDTQRLESLGLLAGGIAHDFNNLLTAVFARLTSARREAAAGTRLADDLDGIEDISHRAAELCAHLLTYAGRGSATFRTVCIGSLARDTALLVRSTIPRAIEIDLALDGAGLVAEVDATQIRQVLMNLLINAAEAIGDRSGTIVMRSREVRGAPGEAKAWVELSVADNGCGMDAETVRRIFDPFFTTKTTGRGLGLAAVDGIVRAHRGKLVVDSELGKGTTFRLLLPLADPASAQPPASEVRRGYKVLIVDDEETVRGAVARAVGLFGYEVVVADSGSHALELAAGAAELAAVLLDIQMPGVDGHDVLKILRETLPRVPVVVMSGYDEIDAAYAGDALVSFLAKPFTGAELSEAVRRAIAIAARQQESAKAV